MQMENTELECGFVDVAEQYQHDLEELASMVPVLQEANENMSQRLDEANAAVAGLIETNDRLRSELQLTNKALDKTLEHLGVFLPANCKSTLVESEDNSQELVALESKLGKAWGIIAKLEKEKRSIHSQLLYHKYLQTPNSQLETSKEISSLSKPDFKSTKRVSAPIVTSETAADRASTGWAIDKATQQIHVPTKRSKYATVTPSRRRQTQQTRSTANHREIALANITSVDQNPDEVEVYAFRVPKEFIHEKEWKMILDMINKKLSQKSSLVDKLQTDIKHLKYERETLLLQKDDKKPIRKRIA